MRRLAQFVMLLAIGLFFVGCSKTEVDDTATDPVVEIVDDDVDTFGDDTDDTDDSDGADDSDGTDDSDSTDDSDGTE